MCIRRARQIRHKHIWKELTAEIERKPEERRRRRRRRRGRSGKRRRRRRVSRFRIQIASFRARSREGASRALMSYSRGVIIQTYSLPACLLPPRLHVSSARIFARNFFISPCNIFFLPREIFICLSIRLTSG